MSESVRHSVVLRDEDDGKNARHVSARVEDSWDLVLSGQDMGETVEQVFRESEYEYWLTVRAGDVPKVLLELMKERFKDETDFRGWLETKGIPSEFHNWF